jgi:hypothetical protein
MDQVPVLGVRTGLQIMYDFKNLYTINCGMMLCMCFFPCHHDVRLSRSHMNDHKHLQYLAECV